MRRRVGMFGLMDIDRIKNLITVNQMEAYTAEEVFDEILKELNETYDMIHEERTISHLSKTRFMTEEIEVNGDYGVYVIYTDDTSGYCGRTNEYIVKTYAIPFHDGVLILHNKWCSGLERPYGSVVITKLEEMGISYRNYKIE